MITHLGLLEHRQRGKFSRTLFPSLKRVVVILLAVKNQVVNIMWAQVDSPLIIFGAMLSLKVALRKIQTPLHLR